MAAPDFRTTTITASPAEPLEGDVVTFTVSLRNAGDEDATPTHVRLTLPLEGMFIDLTGLETRSLSREEKQAEASVDLPAGAVREFQFRVIAPRDAAGRALIPRVALQHFPSKTEIYESTTVEIGTRLGTDGVAIGGYRITTAGLITLALLISIPVLSLIVRLLMGKPSGLPVWRGWRSGPVGAVFAMVIAIGFWTLFGAMALRDYQSLSWPEASCTILDRRLSVSASTSSTSTRAPQDNNAYTTMLALRYDVNGAETYSTGFDTGSRLSVGGFSGADAGMRRWTIGSQVPCWYAPGNPADVVVRRGFGGAYVFALFPIPVFLFGLWQVRSLMAR